MIRSIHKFLTLFLFLFLTSNISYAQIERIEPPSWWTGMNNPNLQIMLYGDNLTGSKVFTNNTGIKVTSVNESDSPDYIFVNVKISNALKPGRYKFTLTKEGRITEFFYEIGRKGHISPFTGKGFNSEDMVYLLMPDRFINGDTSNDNHISAFEKVDLSNKYGRYGGDIQGMINSLEYLKELGVTKIWATPLLFDNENIASYHGYACSDYYNIDPRLGDNNIFKEYVEIAAKNGIGIIMDFVPNHSGLAHWWNDNLPFKDWINKFPKYTQSNFAMSTHSDIYASQHDNTRCTSGWFDTSMPDMNLKNPYLLTYFIQNAIWWTEWAGLAGLRVDTFPYSDKYAIAELTNGVMREYPDMNIVGECWFSTPQEVAYWEGSSKNRDGYSSNLTNVMDFPLQESIGIAFRESGEPKWGEGMFRIYKSLSLDFIYSNPSQLLIFADNHDTNRISEILNGNIDKYKMMITLLATLRGIPQLYYGTEIMMKTVDGKLGHGEERMQMIKPKDFTPEQESLFNFNSTLFNWRKKSKAVKQGTMKHYWPNDNLYVYFREFENEKVMVIINNNFRSIELDWNRYAESIGLGIIGGDVLTDKVITSGEKFVVSSQSSVILEFKN